MSYEVIYSRTPSEFSRGSSSNMSQNSQKDKDISSVLSRLLHLDHINAKELELLKASAFVKECIGNNLSNCHIFFTGSLIDCSALDTSDVDVMLQVRHTCAINPNEENDFDGNVLKMESKDTQPGYVRLIPVKIGDAGFMETDDLLKSYVEIERKSFISSEKYIQRSIDRMSNVDDFLPPHCYVGLSERHGPCVQLNFSKLRGRGETDNGIGIVCRSWPKEANEWITRPRSQNWPPTSLIEQVKTLPCHILPVGSPNSMESFVEWRYAFILPERELLWNFNSTQIQCYFVFKTLVKHFLEPIAPDQINSFHLKTIMFWISENLNTENWCPANLLWCTNQCFHCLSESIKSKHLPHYFLKERNLFNNKLEEKNANELLLKKIYEIKDNIVMSFLECRERFMTNRPILFSICYVLPEIRSTDDFMFVVEHLLKNLTLVEESLYRNHARRESASATFFIMLSPYDQTMLNSIIEAIDARLNDSIFGFYCKQFLAIRYGMLVLVNARITQEKGTRQSLLAYAKYFFESGIGHDLLASCMYFLTYQNNVGNYSDILEFLKNLFKMNVGMTYSGFQGSDKSCISPDMDNFIPTSKISEEDIVFDVLFSIMDISCVPFAVKFECALLEGRSNWSYCRLHPLVYASYVQFQVLLNTSATDDDLRAAVKHLDRMVRYISEGEDGSLQFSIESHRHYNLLGYSYMAMGDVVTAADYFFKSIRIRPSNGNAAAYHLCILLHKCFLRGVNTRLNQKIS